MEQFIFVGREELGAKESVQQLLEESDVRTTILGPTSYAELAELARANDPPTEEFLIPDLDEDAIEPL